MTSGSSPAVRRVRSRASDAEASTILIGDATRRSDPSECSAERVKSQRPQIQGVGMELAEVETGALAPARLLRASSQIPSPILYAGACPGQPRYRLSSKRSVGSSVPQLSIMNSNPAAGRPGGGGG